jgi:citrate synthase
MTSVRPIESVDLAGIVVGETAISDVRGDEGRLSYRGVDINELVEKPFIDVIWLVVFGAWPDAEERTRLRDFLARHSRLGEAEENLLRGLPPDLHPMLMLQGAVPLLRGPGDDALGKGPAAEHGLFIAARIPALIAGHRRIARGLEPVAPEPGRSLHENFLLMFHGAAPGERQVRMLDAAQILQMEHSFNAGTFAGRVCASTLAPIESAISASIGTLYGRLHGGADQAALEMAAAIGAPDQAAAYVADCLRDKVKIMGMGHREYRTVDPRAKILKPMAMALCEGEESKRLLSTLVAVEEACQQAFAKNGKEIWANVEFYKGAVFHSLGIPSHYFTALFAMARVYGYIAHYLEFSRDSRLIRPRARYNPAH